MFKHIFVVFNVLRVQNAVISTIVCITVCKIHKKVLKTALTCLRPYASKIILEYQVDKSLKKTEKKVVSGITNQLPFSKTIHKVTIFCDFCTEMSSVCSDIIKRPRPKK